MVLSELGCDERECRPRGACLELIAFCADASSEDCAEARRASEKREEHDCRLAWLALDEKRKKRRHDCDTMLLGSMAPVIDGYQETGALKFRLGNVRAGRNDVKTADELERELDAANARAHAASLKMRALFQACAPPGPPPAEWLRKASGVP